MREKTVGDKAASAPGSGERVRVLIGWYGIDYSRPEEPNVAVDRLEYPLIVYDPLADPDAADVDESGYREIRDDEALEAWAEGEFEWWEVREL